MTQTTYRCPNGCDSALVVHRDEYGYQDGLWCIECLESWRAYELDQ